MLDYHHPSRPVNTLGKPWFIEDTTGRSYSFEEVRTRVQGLASSLKTRYNITENDVDYVIAFWAVHRLGAVITAKLIITHPTSQPVALAAAQQAAKPIPRSHILYFSVPSPSNQVEPNISTLIATALQKPITYAERKLSSGEGKTKLALLAFSSGTTGRPKAVAISHYAIIANIMQMSVFNKVTEEYDIHERKRIRVGDVGLGVLPLFHIYGLVINCHWLLFCGMSFVCTTKFNFEEMLRNIEKYKITHLMLVPPHMVAFCKHPATLKYNLSSIRFVICGAAPVAAELSEQFRKLVPRDCEVIQAFGMTETATAVTFSPVEHRVGVPGSAGRLINGIQAKVIKEDGTLAGYDEPGEMVIFTPATAMGYANNKEATEKTFKDGWVYSGDQVKFTPEGDMFVVDRLKEIFKVRGFQVAPAELEGHLLDHPDVADTGVVGIPDEYSGEVPLAFVVLREDARKRAEEAGESDKIKENIMKHVADHKVKYKWLAGGVEFINEIPKTPSGKILRRFLRDKAQKIRAERVTTNTTPAKAKL
ncbi:hypothetical protein Clacol_000387 [Clathrus columnatus]|uniref:Uncharacterized protein n=1 Tax=Clathrus columnatus TaxID=1419009 RepID=A0AAV4ZYF4_9AGAM|nr:hypothetical protein Clacol_000387 [Clathrus columnatus]